MRRCLLRLALLTSAAATVAPAALAESTSGAFRVSATVVRTCRVSTDTPSVHIDCGSGLQPVQITRPSASTASKAGSSGPAVTIEF
jgi:hypothetical protein